MSKKNTNEIKQKNNTKYSNKLLKLTIFIMVIITIILIGLFIMKRTGIIGNIQISSEKYGATTTDKTTNSTTGAEILDAEWSGPVTNFDYTGGVQTYTAPVSGTYKLEVWGAQGGSAYGTGGFGGYSQGLVTLEKGKNLYVSVGGHNNITGTTSATYNGGGQGWAWTDSGVYVSSGGGATSIQTSLIDNGEIEKYSSNQNDVLIVAGGGGGGALYGSSSLFGGSAGGNEGGNIYYTDYPELLVKKSVYTGANQNSSNNGRTDEYHQALGVASGSFGKGTHACGGGWYGGSYYYDGARVYSGAGGSGYISNSLLTNKHMAGYEVNTSSDTNTKTISVENHSSTPISDYAKEGNGYARITLISLE